LLAVLSAALSLAAGLTVRAKLLWFGVLGIVQALAVIAWYTGSVNLGASLVVCVGAGAAPGYWLVRRHAQLRR